MQSLSLFSWVVVKFCKCLPAGLYVESHLELLPIYYVVYICKINFFLNNALLVILCFLKVALTQVVYVHAQTDVVIAPS